jgi:molecular chaperone GrpE
MNSEPHKTPAEPDSISENEVPQDMAVPAPAETGPMPEQSAPDLKQELEKMREQTLRAMADAENTRKRMDRERDDIRKYAISPFARDMLGISDTLHRALESVPAELRESDARVNNLLEGLEATERELNRIFERNKIIKINPLGEMFNPNFHEVMFETPGTGKPNGTITLVIEAGYILHERLLRPARVGIAKDSSDFTPPAGGTVDTQA